jgi:hypothetical protein
MRMRRDRASSEEFLIHVHADNTGATSCEFSRQVTYTQSRSMTVCPSTEGRNCGLYSLDWLIILEDTALL